MDSSSAGDTSSSGDGSTSSSGDSSGSSSSSRSSSEEKKRNDADRKAEEPKAASNPESADPLASSAGRPSAIKQGSKDANPKLASIQEQVEEINQSAASSPFSKEALDEKEALLQERHRLTEDLKLQNAYLKNNWECFKDYISVEKDILEQQEYEKFRIHSSGDSDESVHQIRYENWQELTT